MNMKNNIIKFPNQTDKKKEKMVQIRDEIERLLTNYALSEKDLWAVSLAAGRFSCINLEKLEGEQKTLDFFKSCIKTQRKFDLSRDSSNIT